MNGLQKLTLLLVIIASFFTTNTVLSKGRRPTDVKKHVVRKQEKPPRPKPPPDPLANAWRGDAKIPQLGNGTMPSEFLVGALRILGISDSFNEDTFIRHLLYVTAIARKDIFPEETFAESVRNRLVSRKLLLRDRSPRAGDLIFFDLRGKVLVGVVEKANQKTVTFIAPINGEIRRGVATLSAATGKDTQLLKCIKKKSGTRQPCRAGELFIGSADVEKLISAFR